MGRFYITGAIDYPNGAPHMGHAYEKIVADCHARWHRFLGERTRFLVGTDENGQKLSESAAREGVGVGEFIDRNAAVFKRFWGELGLGHDDFIRTSEGRHADVCQELWSKMEQAGDIRRGRYSGLYCLSCESFYPESQAPEGRCPHHGKKLPVREEEGLFFSPGRHREWLLGHIKADPGFITPAGARREVLSRLEREELRDVAFTRPNEGRGVPVPGHEDEFVMYTWADALISYYTSTRSEGAGPFWPADVHVIGRDIIWFHCVLWPCMLRSAGLPPPRQVLVHGMILGEDGRKMSKSLGNAADPRDIVARYPLDSFRYYLLRSFPLQGDGAFSERELADKHNNELGNDFGNLVMRVLKLSLGRLPPEIGGEAAQGPDFSETLGEMRRLMEGREHNRALDALWASVGEANRHINATRPWELKSDLPALGAAVHRCCFMIHQLARMMGPFMPTASERALGFLGVGPEAPRLGETVYRPSPPSPLFPRIEGPPPA